MKLGLVVVLASSAAAAKPLPPAWKVSLVKNRIMATRSGVSVPVFSDQSTKLVKADLSDDGTTLRVIRETCMGGQDGTTPEETPLLQLEAAVENTLGMKLHVKKKYADAITHFAFAAAFDPATPVYATNLLSAQSMGGKLDDADKTIAGAAKQNVAWLAWRLQVDPELQPLAGRPSTKLVAKPSTARSKLGSVFYSPFGIAAVETGVDIFDGIPDGHSDNMMTFVDVASGKVLLRLPTESTCGMDMEAMENDPSAEPKQDPKCVKAQAAAAVKARKVVDGVLAAISAEPVKGGYTTLLGGDDVKEVASADGRKVILGDTPKIVAGGKSRELQPEGRMYGIAFVPKAVLVMHKGGKHIDGCDADGPYDEEIQVEATP